MRRTASHGRNFGLPASERLKWKLSSTAGMHMVAAMEEDDASSWNQVLHSTAWAARNFRQTVESISRTSSDSGFLQLQAARQGSQDGSEIVAEMQNRLTGSSTGDQIFSAEATGTSSGDEIDERTVAEAEAPNRYVSGVHSTETRTVNRESAAVRIQAAYRRARRLFIAKSEAATKIQAVFRMWLARKQHAELCRTAVQIQRWYRSRLSRRLEKQILLEATLATAMQAHVRGFLVRRIVQRWNAAACIIQQSWRRSKLQSIRKSFAAATKIQACYRRSVARKQYLLARKSAIRIQEAYRRWTSEQHLLKNSSAACIQAHVRGFRTRLMLHRWNGAACLIQQRWRSFHRQAAAAKLIQRQWRLFKVFSSTSSSESGVEPPVSSDSHREDWNTVEVDHLEHCLDTCLATLHPQLRSQQCGLNLPVSPGCSPAKSIPIEELSAYKWDLKEKRLQQAARVFLLQHHIAIQQQRAQHAPPFPPWQQQRESGGDNNSYSNNSERKTIQTQTDYRKPNTEALPQAQGDVILDVQYLLEQIHKLTSNGGSSSSVVYMQNDSTIIDIDFTGEKLKTTRQHQQLVGFKQMNALLVVFVAVIIYTKSICQGVFVWAKRPAKK